MKVIQMMPAVPGMYAELEGAKKGTTEYRLIVMWVLLQAELEYDGDESQKIIGLTSDDIVKNEIIHDGYDNYTTAVPKDNDTVRIVR